MLDKNSGSVSCVKNKIPDAMIYQCMLHRHTHMAKNLPENLKNTLSNAVKTVNYVRGRAIVHCLFHASCKVIGSLHTILLFHTEVRWLSRGQMLSRVYKLHEEITQFLNNQGSNLVDNSEKRVSFLQLAYLADKCARIWYKHHKEQRKTVSFYGKPLNWIKWMEKMILSTFLRLQKLFQEMRESQLHLK